MPLERSTGSRWPSQAFLPSLLGLSALLVDTADKWQMLPQLHAAAQAAFSARAVVCLLQVLGSLPLEPKGPEGQLASTGC